MRFNGGVVIDGEWDPDTTLQYLEQRNRQRIIPTMRSDGSVFQLNGKYVQFCDDHVMVVSFG